MILVKEAGSTFWSGLDPASTCPLFTSMAIQARAAMVGAGMGDTATTGAMPFSSVSVAAICDWEAPEGVVADCVGFVAGAGAGELAAGLAAGLPVLWAHAADAPTDSVAINAAANTRRPAIKGETRGKRELVIGKSGKKGSVKKMAGSRQL
jgi:hypothetical protein